MQRNDPKENKIEANSKSSFFDNRYPRHFTLFTEKDDSQFRVDFANYLEKLQLFDHWIKAGSIDNVDDPIVWRRIFNAFLKFCEVKEVSFDEDEPLDFDELPPKKQKEFLINLENHLKKREPEFGVFKPTI